MLVWASREARQGCRLPLSAPLPLPTLLPLLYRRPFRLEPKRQFCTRCASQRGRYSLPACTPTLRHVCGARAHLSVVPPAQPS